LRFGKTLRVSRNTEIKRAEEREQKKAEKMKQKK
jgi:hypothetical protein